MKQNQDKSVKAREKETEEMWEIKLEQRRYRAVWQRKERIARNKMEGNEIDGKESTNLIRQERTGQELVERSRAEGNNRRNR